MSEFNVIHPGSLSGNSEGHRPVLLQPLIQHLHPKAGQVVVDGTLGAGGVTAALLEHVLPGGIVVAIDRDPAAAAAGKKRFEKYGDSVRVVHGNFADLSAILRLLHLDEVDAITFDVGISSLQLDDPRRGFSFRYDGPLDMRMDQSDRFETAADIVNSRDEVELANLIYKYGDERYSRAIARAIVAQRPMSTTTQLRELIEKVIPRSKWPKRIHPATRTFQALRIVVNDELGNLDKGLQAAIDELSPGGRIGVITFHSLEDTIVKNTLHVAARNCLCPPQQPICTCAHRAILSLPFRKAIQPTDEEISANPRARSARLRVAQKI